MAYSSITQSAQVVAQEVAGLLPGHPRLASSQSLAYITGQTPAPTRHGCPRPARRRPGHPGTGTAAPGRCSSPPGCRRSEVDLTAELPARAPTRGGSAVTHLPELTAVDEAVTEPHRAARRAATCQGLHQPLRLPGRPGHHRPGRRRLRRPGPAVVRADVSASGKIIWSHDGWLPLPHSNQPSSTRPAPADDPWPRWPAPGDTPRAGMSRRMHTQRSRAQRGLPLPDHPQPGGDLGVVRGSGIGTGRQYTSSVRPATWRVRWCTAALRASFARRTPRLGVNVTICTSSVAYYHIGDSTWLRQFKECAFLPFLSVWANPISRLSPMAGEALGGW